jgi:hypothetical protein
LVQLYRAIKFTHYSAVTTCIHYYRFGPANRLTLAAWLRKL